MRTHLWIGFPLALALAACGAPASPPDTPTAPDAPEPYSLLAASKLSIDKVSGESEAPGSPAQRALDGNTKTAWSSGSGKKPKTWLLLSFSRPHVFSELRIMTGVMPAGTTFKVAASMDGQTWEPISGRLKNNSDRLESKDLYGQGRYMRVQFYNSASDPTDHFNVSEIEVYGDSPARPAISTPAAVGVAAEPLRRFYPDWLAIPPRKFALDGEKLSFETAIGNLGPGYVQIRNRNPSRPSGQAVQEILDNRQQVVLRQNASSFIYFEPHGHNHVEDIARYELRSGGPNGPMIRSGSKRSFCVEDSYRFRNMGLPSLYPDCTSELMGITPGYADVYTADVPGQSFDMSNLPPGDYTIVVRIDPLQKFLDYSRNNNVAWTKVYVNPYSGTVSELSTGH